MNVEYFSVKEIPQLDSGTGPKKESHSSSAERRDFNSSYQTVRKEQAERTRAAQENNARKVDERNKTSQANNRQDERERTVDHPKATKTNEGVNKQARTKTEEGKEDGKPLPSSEHSGNSRTIKTEDEKKHSVFELVSGNEQEEIEIQLDQGDSRIDKNPMRVDKETEEALLSIDEGDEKTTEDLKVDTETSELKQEVASATSDIELNPNAERNSFEENNEYESGEAEGLLSASDPVSEIKANVVSETDGQKSINDNNDDQVEAPQVSGLETESEPVADSELMNGMEVPAEKAAVITSPGTGRTERSNQSDLKNTSTKNTASVTKIGSGANKAAFDSGLGEGVPREVLEEQLASMKTENGKADIKSFITENHSASELALKEAKSGVTNKGLDFAKTLAGEKQPLRETIELPVSHKNWGEALAEKTALLVGKKGTFARLNLVPHNLGPLEIRVQLQGETSSVEFIALNPATKDVIESAIPRLREMFEAGGIDLGDVNVNSQSQKDGNEEQVKKTINNQLASDENMELEEAELQSDTRAMLLDGRVDFYA